MSADGFTFDPSNKTIEIPKPSVSKDFLNKSLDDIIKEKNQKARAEKKAIRDSKTSSKKRNQRDSRSNAPVKKDGRKKPRQEKKDRKNEAKRGVPQKRKTELDVPESALRAILSEAGIDTDNYNLRLVAYKK